MVAECLGLRGWFGESEESGVQSSVRVAADSSASETQECFGFVGNA